MRRLLPLVLALAGCAHLSQVQEGIRVRDIAGAWKSERGGFFQIGCGGSFDFTPLDAALVQPQVWQGSGARISEVDAAGFTVSRFPLSSIRYQVEEWPRFAGSLVVMRAEGLRWVRTKTLDCQ